MDKLTEMEVYAAVIQRGGLSAAARELELTPSAVSKLIKRLENRLGVRLLNRTTRRLSTTEAGQQFYQRCLDILSAVEDAENTLSNYGQIAKGKLRINSTAGFARHQLLPILMEFQEEYPQLELELQLSGIPVDLVAEQVDVAIRLGVLEDTSLVARHLGESRRIVCASPEYLKLHGKPRVPSDLKSHSCLRLSTSRSFNLWRFQTPDGEQLIEARGGFLTNDVNALCDYAMQGGGIARLSSFMVGRLLEDGKLIALLENYEKDQQQIHALYPNRKQLPGKVKAFISFLQNKLSDRPLWD
ncbi:MAG: LysR family transcriptional regulator [Marinobacter sp.]